ncbi:MAG: KamA family radical SAM protein [Pseudomonadota bacterium]
MLQEKMVTTARPESSPPSVVPWTADADSSSSNRERVGKGAKLPNERPNEEILESLAVSPVDWSQSEPANRARARARADDESFAHRQLLEGSFWQRIPGYASIDEKLFLDHAWQAKHSITNLAKLRTVVGDMVDAAFVAEAEAGLRRSPMSVRVSPYIISLIDWTDPYRDPLRRQFIPVDSDIVPDHPKVGLDSLGEQADSPVRGLTHRYRDRALFLALDTCPVYCRFCTRSYAVGESTGRFEKLRLGVNEERWRQAFAYIKSRPEIEDVVVSGGDCSSLRPAQIEQIGNALLDIPHIRRMRLGTRGLAVLPQKVLTDDAWLNALSRVVDRARKEHREVAIHTHFNHPREITSITRTAANRLFERGILVRNQTVLQRGVNDDPTVLTTLVKRLSYINVRPYYVYVHDLVRGVEDLRTTLQTAIDLEKQVRGATSGFNTPSFACDAPGGGGKRDVHSFEHYNRVTGISVFTSPSVKPGRYFLYFDPIRALPAEGQALWADESMHDRLIANALAAAQR